ncbi:MAG: DUF3325 domain-containing protein [Candidatus Accumulibacter sp.]|jgi:hypothetical protein|nr:DUF3325 domain-containing protein [Accumulibacter sp.]
MNLLSLALVFWGFAAIAAGMERHARDIFAASPSSMRSPRVRRLRLLAGYLLLALALPPAIAAHGLSIGVSVWFGFLALASTALALILSWRPRILRRVLR